MEGNFKKLNIIELNQREVGFDEVQLRRAELWLMEFMLVMFSSSGYSVLSTKPETFRKVDCKVNSTKCRPFSKMET